MSSSFGEKLKVTIFGASHGSHIGVVLEGLDAGDRSRGTCPIYAKAST